MNTMDLLELIGQTPDKYVQDVADPVKKRTPAKRIWLIAAVITALAILAGCVAYVLNLNDLILFEKTYEDYTTGETEPRVILSLQGAAGSDGYMACREWEVWRQNYDQEYELYSEEACTAFPIEYQMEHVYTQEMKDKLDEICEKYDVELMGRQYRDTENQFILDALQISGVCRENDSAEAEEYIRYFYANGSFVAECTITLEEDLWDTPIHMEFICYRENAFTSTYLPVVNFEKYEQWNYTTAGGDTVLLAIGPEKAMIFTESDHWFITAVYYKITEEDLVMDKPALEAVAEVFDYSVSPSAPNEECLAEADARIEAESDEHAQQQQALAEGFTAIEVFGAASYETRVRYCLERHPEADKMGYALQDLDGDGKPELLLGMDGYIHYMFTQTEEEAFGLVDWWHQGTAVIMEDGSIAFMEMAEDHSWGRIVFFRVEDGTRAEYKELLYSPGFFGEESHWQRRDEEGYHPTTQQEYEAVLESIHIEPIEMIPLSLYPLSLESQ